MTIEISVPSGPDSIKHLSARLAVAEENVRIQKDHNALDRLAGALADHDEWVTRLGELFNLSPKPATLTETTDARA